MDANTIRTLEEEYEGRFSWRTNDNLQRMNKLLELTGNTGGGGQAMFDAYPNLKHITVNFTPEESLSVSIFQAWVEVCECFIFGESQAVILLCRSIAERSLKLEYIKAHGELPAGKWMLGKLINECAGLVAPDILNLARELSVPGNDRAHALLEVDDPQMAVRGGKNRGITVTSPSTYMIEPFRGDAEIAIRNAHLIIQELYG